MRSKLQMTPLALAVAALFVSPLAFGGGGERGNHDRIKVKNEVNVKIKQKVKIVNDVRIQGGARVVGTIPVSAEAGVLVDDKQISKDNEVNNYIVDNDAAANGNALRDAQGNIGVNVTAGDNNVQSNDVGLAAIDANFVFANSGVVAYQKSSDNRTYNKATRNNASASGNLLENARGNIGVNISAGSSNLQKNNLGASRATGASLVKATVAAKQETKDNYTDNEGKLFLIPVLTRIELRGGMEGNYEGGGQGAYGGFTGGSYRGDTGGSMSGSTAGRSWQANNYYPDVWSSPTDTHPCSGCDQTHHIDMDAQAQGAVANPFRPGVGGLAFDEFGGYSGSYRGTESGTYRGGEFGGLGFSESGSMSLSGSFSGHVLNFVPIFRPHANNASLNGNTLANAQGNIGVNVAAGSNNLQNNSLAIATGTRFSGPGPVPGPSE